MLRGIRPLSHYHRMSIAQCRGAFDNRDAGIGQHAPIDTIKTFDFGVFVGNQPGPVKTDLIPWHVPAIARSVLDVFTRVRTIDKQFLRHAAHIHAGSTEIARFHHSHTSALGSGHACQPDTTGTGTHNNKIKILSVRHSVSCLFRQSVRSTGNRRLFVGADLTE